MKPIRVLHVLNSLGSGGAESFIMSVYRNINRQEVQFDFLIRDDKNNILIDEIKQLGGEVFTHPEFPKKAIQNYVTLYGFMKNKHSDYEAVHVHANALLYVSPIILAKKFNIKHRILHSHNSRVANGNGLYKLIHNSNKKRIKKYTTANFACADFAGKWMFNDGYTVINNAIDTEKFKFDEINRAEIRKEFHLEGKFVLGNIGRFVYQKNHDFLIDIFMEVRKQNPDAYLLLVGDGELKAAVEDKVTKNDLQDYVIFAGVRKDVQKLLSAMDLFIMPSRFEGLPIVLVEAQNSGLQCITTKDVVTAETKITELLHFVSAEESPKKWATAITALRNNGYQRATHSAALSTAGFDIVVLARELEKFYLGKA